MILQGCGYKKPPYYEQKTKKQVKVVIQADDNVTIIKDNKQ